jgi:hypothetical protein
VHDKPVMEQDWREVPRSEWFERLILTVDSTRGEAESLGDEATMRRCDEQIEFLEAEIVRAKNAETGASEDDVAIISDHKERARRGY